MQYRQKSRHPSFARKPDREATQSSPRAPPHGPKTRTGVPSGACIPSTRTVQRSETALDTDLSAPTFGYRRSDGGIRAQLLLRPASVRTTQVDSALAQTRSAPGALLATARRFASSTESEGGPWPQEAPIELAVNLDVVIPAS